MPILNLKYIKSDSVKEKNIQLVYENYINLSTLEQKIVLFYILEAIKDFDHIGYYEIGNSVVSLNQAAGLGKNPSTSIEDFKAISLAVIHLSLDNVEIYSEYWDEVRVLNTSWLSLDDAPFEIDDGRIEGHSGNLITYYGEDILKLIAKQGLNNLDI